MENNKSRLSEPSSSAVGPEGITGIEKLRQEHAIYKQFYQSMRNRPLSDPNRTTYIKAGLFDVIERLEMLERGIYFYDPKWQDADQVLFPIS